VSVLCNCAVSWICELYSVGEYNMICSTDGMAITGENRTQIPHRLICSSMIIRLIDNLASRPSEESSACIKMTKHLISCREKFDVCYDNHSKSVARMWAKHEVGIFPAITPKFLFWLRWGILLTEGYCWM
jgi:hypothetical protein